MYNLWFEKFIRRGSLAYQGMWNEAQLVKKSVLLVNQVSSMACDHPVCYIHIVVMCKELVC